MANYRDYKGRLEGEATLAILNLDHAPLILSFLDAVFRAEHAVTRPEGMLIDRLTSHLDEINESEDAPSFTKSAGQFLDVWVAKGVLNRRHTETLEVVYDLTPAAEQALAFVQGIERRHTVGAESKLKLIARTLQDLSENSDPDVERRVKVLDQRIQSLRDEIHALNMGAKPRVYTANEKRERYRLALDTGRELQRDFGVIRERFKALARTIADHYSATGVNRGDVLRRALDDNAVLRDSPEGQSFTAFQNFLLDPQSQAELRRLVDEADQLDDIDPADRANRFLRHLPGILLTEAKAVVVTNERLSDSLRRVLDSSNARSRAEAQSVIREIMALAFEMKQSPPNALVSFNFELGIAAAEAAVRPLWREPADPPALPATEAAAEGDGDALAAGIVDLATVDFARLANQIGEGFTRLGNGFTLRELLGAIPPQPHLAILDVLGYLELARRDPQHCILQEQKKFLFAIVGSERALLLPEVEFYRFESSSK